MTRPSTVAWLLPFTACSVNHGQMFGSVAVEGFAAGGPSAIWRHGPRRRRRSRTPSTLHLGLGEYAVDLDKPLGMILEERGAAAGGGVLVREVLKGAGAGSAWRSGRVAPREVLLRVDETDVATCGLDRVMELLAADVPAARVALGDGLGRLDMPKNVLRGLASTEDAFLVDGTVREAVRAVRRDGRLGDLLRVEVVIGAGVTGDTDADGTARRRAKVRFFGIFSTDGVSTYSCNISATGVHASAAKEDGDPNKDIRIVALSCAKDEGLGRTYDLIREE